MSAAVTCPHGVNPSRNCHECEKARSRASSKRIRQRRAANAEFNKAELERRNKEYESQMGVKWDSPIDTLDKHPI